MAQNYAVIENKKVTNIVVSEADVAMERGWILVPEGSAISIDWDYENGQFVDSRPKQEPVTQEITLTKEELLFQLQMLTNQINSI